MPPSRVAPHLARSRDNRNETPHGYVTRHEVTPPADPAKYIRTCLLMDGVDAESRSRAARRRHHHRRALHAADAAYPPRGIGGPNQQGAAGDDRAWLFAVILDRGVGAERDYPRLRLRSQPAAQRRGNPAYCLRAVDDLAGAV